jgi:hypothetical protein
MLASHTTGSLWYEICPNSFLANTHQWIENVLVHAQRQVAGLQAVEARGVINVDVSELLSGAQWGHSYHDRVAPLLAAVHVRWASQQCLTASHCVSHWVSLTVCRTASLSAAAGFVRRHTDQSNPLLAGALVADEAHAFTALAQLLLHTAGTALAEEDVRAPVCYV